MEPTKVSTHSVTKEGNPDSSMFRHMQMLQIGCPAAGIADNPAKPCVFASSSRHGQGHVMPRGGLLDTATRGEGGCSVRQRARTLELCTGLHLANDSTHAA